jgi:hypothetical protein
MKSGTNHRAKLLWNVLVQNFQKNFGDLPRISRNFSFLGEGGHGICCTHQGPGVFSRGIFCKSPDRTGEFFPYFSGGMLGVVELFFPGFSRGTRACTGVCFSDFFGGIRVCTGVSVPDFFGNTPAGTLNRVPNLPGAW